MQPFAVGKTHQGQDRDTNEDALFIDDELGLYMVSDGMGGHAAGEVAAQTAIETAVRYVRGERATLSAHPADEVDAAFERVQVRLVATAPCNGSKSTCGRPGRSWPSSPTRASCS